MGNKTNAIALRTGINKNWKSIWYQHKSRYADTVLSDVKIRKLVQSKAAAAGIAKMVIKRSTSRIIVEMTVSRPGVVIGKGGKGIEDLESDIKKMGDLDVKVKVFEVKRPEIQAKLVGENIAAQLEKRIPPKKAILRVTDAAMNTGMIKGIHVWVSGRIKGADIARVEKVEVGTVPRHTLRNDIDYALVEANVPQAGIHGIKVWINKGEKHDYEISTQL